MYFKSITAKLFESKKFELVSIIGFLCVLINLVQTKMNLGSIGSSIKLQLFLLVHGSLLLFFLIFNFIKIAKKESLLVKLGRFFFTKLPIPKGAKVAILIVLLGNCASIIIGKPLYPFYDVGMFRWNTAFVDKSATVYKPKYYFYEEGVPKILELRKESFYFLSEHFGLRYNHEFTFAAAFHNRGQKENFDFIATKLKEQGIDTLWVGVHSVNYNTKEVLFETDICNAITVNKRDDLHYGPIYIPEYQIKKCNGN